MPRCHAGQGQQDALTSVTVMELHAQKSKTYKAALA